MWNTGSSHRFARLLILIFFWVSACPGHAQNLQSAGAGCSVGQPGTTASLSGITTEQLAAGGLVSSLQYSWDFGVSEGLLKAAPGQNVTLACIAALNASISLPTAPVFLQPMAINVSGVTGVVMENVILSTNCSAVLVYQAYFCSQYNVSGSLTLQRGAVHFSSWEDGFSSLRNVTLTCPGAPEAAPAPPCWLAAVRTDVELLDAFLSYMGGISSNVTIVISNNITINKSSWPVAPVQVNHGVVLAGSSRLYRPVLDLNLLVALWELLPAISVGLLNLTCVNLAPTYISPVFPSAMFALMTERVWAFRRTERQLYIVNSTLVIPKEELLYMTHWLKYLTSPVPEDQAKAAWLSVLDLKISKVNATGIYYDVVVSFTATYTNVLLTDTLEGYPLLPLDLGLELLISEEVPLSAVRQVVNASDFLAALSPSTLQPDSKGRRWLFLTQSFSLAGLPNGTAGGSGSSSSAAGAVQLPGSTVMGVGAGLRSVRLDFGPRPNVLALAAGSALMLRSLTLGDLPPRATVYNPQSPLDVLLSPLWGVSGADPSSATMDITNATVLVGGAELRLLQQCLLPPGSNTGPDGPSVDAAIPAALRAFFASARVASYNESYLQLASGATARYTFTNLTFRTPVAAAGEAAVEDPVLPPAAADTGGGGLEGWQVGVLVGCVVGGVVLLALLLGRVLAVRRRRGRQSGAHLDDAARRQGAYEKYLRNGGAGGNGAGLQGGGAAGGGGGAAAAGPGASSDLVHPSHELTNSSQVLRPDARRSDLEAAAALKAAGSGTVSASGGIGTAGRSTSTTGVTIPDISSGAVLPSVGVSCAAVAPVSSSAGVSGSASASASASGGVRAPAAYERPLGSATAGHSAQSSITAAAAAAAAAGSGPGHVGCSQVTDSFERPPSSTVLGQHGPVGRYAARLGSVAGTSGPSSTPSSLAMQTQSIMATGGAGALEQMHQMIQVLGRDFNDKQLEVYGMLGKGAHGTVYRGTWRGLPVAVKSMVVSNDSSARQQSRILMEAAISSSLAHPNIVTTYAYELREVEHELASISPELARQGGGWRLLIIQEYCDAGPLRRLVDCGFFLTPPKPSSGRPRLKLPSVGLSRKDSPSGEGSVGSATRHDTSAGHTGPAAGVSRGSSGSSETGGNGSSRAAPAPEPAAAGLSPGASRMGQAPQPSGAQHQQLQQPRPALEPVPADVPPRPSSSLIAARRYVEAALMIARGLQHIHDKNIVHGDLNPNNVLLMRAPGTWLGYCLKVADFGLSVRMAEGESHMSNLFQGSPYYCAPEVVLSGKIGKSADIYSLGIMLWELQNGTRPLWRSGVRLRSYPSLNTAELDFGADTPPRYVRLTRDCFHASKDARPIVSSVVETLEAIKAQLEAL